MKVWLGSPDQPVDIEMVEQEMLDNRQRYPIKKTVVDPWQMASTVQRFKKRNIPIEEFIFSASSIQRLSEALYGVIVNCRLAVPEGIGRLVDRNGRVSTFKSEVTRLITEETRYGWRIDHTSRGYSDRSITVGMGIVVLSGVTMREPRCRTIRVKKEGEDGSGGLDRSGR